jgi:hypothetical protein
VISTPGRSVSFAHWCPIILIPGSIRTLLYRYATLCHSSSVASICLLKSFRAKIPSTPTFTPRMMLSIVSSECKVTISEAAMFPLRPLPEVARSRRTTASVRLSAGWKERWTRSRIVSSWLTPGRTSKVCETWSEQMPHRILMTRDRTCGRDSLVYGRSELRTVGHYLGCGILCHWGLNHRD